MPYEPTLVLAMPIGITSLLLNLFCQGHADSESDKLVPPYMLLCAYTTQTHSTGTDSAGIMPAA